MRRRSVRTQTSEDRPSTLNHTILQRGRVPMASLVQTLAVAEHLNFRHAANALGLCQSGISARVKTLEQDLGVHLFERHARGVRLTEAGRRFVEGVAAGLDQIDDTIRTIGTMARGEIGRLRVGVPALIPGSVLANLLACYRDRHPSIEVEIAEGTARDSVMQLREDRLDLAFVARAPEIPDCHSRRLWSERLLAVLPSSHPFAGCEGVTWADLASEAFLVRHGGTGPQVHDLIVQRLAERLPPSSIQRFSVERATLLSMVAQGYGVTIAGEATSLMHAPGVAFLPVLDEPQPIAFSAIWSPYNRSPALRNLLAMAAKMTRSG